jgi:outer membrane immunogenic protein
LSRNWTARAEYLYVDLGSATVRHMLSERIVAYTQNQLHILRLGVNYKFSPL